MSAVEAAVYRPSSPRREAIIAERQRLGHDGRDEVWEGVYVMPPAAKSNHGDLQFQLGFILRESARAAGLRVVMPYNIGTPSDFRIPDIGLMRPCEDRTFGTGDTALVVEIRSPNDDTYKKFGFYFRDGVDEVVVVDPSSTTIEWYERGESGFDLTAVSALLGLAADEVQAQIEW
jgi:Uma2 family endonuclease